MKELPLLQIGIIIIIIGITIALSGALQPKPSNTEQKEKPSLTVVGFIGPIPFGFGNDKNMLMTALAISAAIAIVFFLGMRIIKP